MTRRRFVLGALLALAIGGTSVLWVSLAGAEGPTTIKCSSEAKKTTEAIEQAVGKPRYRGSDTQGNPGQHTRRRLQGSVRKERHADRRDRHGTDV